MVVNAVGLGDSIINWKTVPKNDVFYYSLISFVRDTGLTVAVGNFRLTNSKDKKDDFQQVKSTLNAANVLKQDELDQINKGCNAILAAKVQFWPNRTLTVEDLKALAGKNTEEVKKYLADKKLIVVNNEPAKKLVKSGKPAAKKDPAKPADETGKTKPADPAAPTDPQTPQDANDADLTLTYTQLFTADQIAAMKNNHQVKVQDLESSGKYTPLVDLSNRGSEVGGVADDVVTEDEVKKTVVTVEKYAKSHGISYAEALPIYENAKSFAMENINYDDYKTAGTDAAGAMGITADTKVSDVLDKIKNENVKKAMEVYLTGDKWLKLKTTDKLGNDNFEKFCVRLTALLSISKLDKSAQQASFGFTLDYAYEGNLFDKDHVLSYVGWSAVQDDKKSEKGKEKGKDAEAGKTKGAGKGKNAGKTGETGKTTPAAGNTAGLSPTDQQSLTAINALGDEVLKTTTMKDYSKQLSSFTSQYDTLSSELQKSVSPSLKQVKDHEAALKKHQG